MFPSDPPMLLLAAMHSVSFDEYLSSFILNPLYVCTGGPPLVRFLILRISN
jgi:hypothetical protein